MENLKPDLDLFMTIHDRVIDWLFIGKKTNQTQMHDNEQEHNGRDDLQRCTVQFPRMQQFYLPIRDFHLHFHRYIKEAGISFLHNTLI